MHKHLFAVAVLALVAVAVYRPAAADYNCPNGIVDLGEECDDGNLIAGDCCSPGCQYESPTTVCRSSVDVCDAPEYCTGDSAVCPPDTGLTGDTDGDGTCDAADPCPGSADPAQLLDTDADGIADACDLCTNYFTKVTGFRLRMRKLQLPLGQQRLSFHMNAIIPDEPAIDPETKPIRLILTDGREHTVFDVTVPAQTYDGVTRTGWINFGNGRWVFNDGFDSVLGVDTASVTLRRALEPHAVNAHIAIRSHDGTASLRPKWFPATLRLVLDTPFARTSQCAELTLTAEQCLFRNGGQKLICR